MFAEGGSPKVIMFGSGHPYPLRHIAQVNYVEDPTTGHYWVEMDQRFLNEFMPLLAAQGIRVEWMLATESLCATVTRLDAEVLPHD